MKGFKYSFILLAVTILVLLFSCSKKEKASCSDGKLNQDEIRTDCGGVCAPCQTCSDGILNQDEVKIDCGGVCSVCQTCTDGIQNQSETGVDCGGPCGKCPIIYPENGIYGKNLLAYRKYDTTMVSGNYSLAAELSVGSKLRVVFSNPTGQRINYGTVSGGNWQVIYAPDNLIQTFIVNGAIVADKQFVFGDSFFGGIGEAKMEIYENDATTPTWIKYLRWQ